MAEQSYRKCGNPLCDRRVLGATHCCGACVHAGQNGYEIHEHTDSCNVRAAMRGPYQPGRDF